MEKTEVCETDVLRAEIRRLRGMLSRLTPPLAVMLRRRGFAIDKKEPRDDLLIPTEDHLDSYYEMLKRYSFRLFLRDVIKHQPLFRLAQVTRYATREVTQEYVDYLLGVDIISLEHGGYQLRGGPIKSFGETLEWFLAEIFRKEFLAEAVWGVKMKKRAIGGDYDLLAKIDGSILYMEIKSSPPKQIYQKEVGTFLERVDDLRPEVAVFLDDTELRMKDKIVPMFEEELRARLPEPPEVLRIKHEIFGISGGASGRSMIFIMNAKDSIITNTERVLAEYFRRIT
jgi:hypothetical protein